MNATQDRRRRDWSIIIFILPLGVVMMMCVGQQAIRMSPSWSVNGDMNSSLDPENAPKQNVLVIPPISSDILTPVTWWDTFLTPMSGDEGDGVVVFPPFITFEPSATPSATASSSATPTTTTLTTTSTATGTPPTQTKTPTKNPTDDDTSTVTVTATTTTPIVTATTVTTTATTTTPTGTATTITSTATATATTPPTCTDPAANNNGGPLPCVYTPTPPATCTDSAASNFGGPLPCVYPPTTCTDPLANNNGGPLPCIYPVSSTPEGTQTAVPSQVTVGTPDGSLGVIDDGEYIVLDLTLSGTPIVVTDPSDTNYDLAYYERFTAGGVDMDSVIISISMDDIDYYVVFNWGNGTPDNNSNVGDVVTNTGTENDNQHIDGSELYDPDGGGSAPDTGILIDVDNAPSNPPPGDYWYVAIEAPSPPPPPPVVPTDGADVDSIEIVDIAPTP